MQSIENRQELTNSCHYTQVTGPETLLELIFSKMQSVARARYYQFHIKKIHRNKSQDILSSLIYHITIFIVK